MKKLPSIIIWKLELTQKGFEDIPQCFYFLTKGGVRRFLKRFESEIKENFTWRWGGVPLWLW